MTLTPEVKQYLAQRLRSGAIVAFAGGSASLVGWIAAPDRFRQAWLVSFLYWFEIALGCFAVALLHGMSGGGWGRTIRRVVEAGYQTLPLMAALFVPIWIEAAHIYVWADPDVVRTHETLARKAGYLDLGAFRVRAAVYFAIWIGIGLLLDRCSPNGERSLDSPRSRRLQRVSGIGFVALGVTTTLAVVDWAMSLEPDWYSTMYGLIHIAGTGVSGFSTAIIVVVALKDFPPWSQIVTPSRLNNLGNLLLAAVMFWAYCSYFQYLVIWSGNLPEENVWYLRRSQNGWQFVVLGLVVLHFAVPFLLLLSRHLKRQPRDLARISGLLLVMRYVDLYWLIVPGFDQSGSIERTPGLHWLDFAATAAIGGSWLTLFAWRLSARASLPIFDPETPEEIHDHERACDTV